LSREPNATQRSLPPPYNKQNPTAQLKPTLSAGDVLTGRAKNKGIKEGKTAVVGLFDLVCVGEKDRGFVTVTVHLTATRVRTETPAIYREE